eukprot:5256444-Pyramimonas_sp.AAC.1
MQQLNLSLLRLNILLSKVLGSDELAVEHRCASCPPLSKLRIGSDTAPALVCTQRVLRSSSPSVPATASGVVPSPEVDDQKGLRLQFNSRQSLTVDT